jgi:hypothetical protein
MWLRKPLPAFPHPAPRNHLPLLPSVGPGIAHHRPRSASRITISSVMRLKRPDLPRYVSSPVP